jgi:glycosyltransferase involved in cell wall biosynthesis
VKIALVVPGGVDRSAQFRVIPALLALIRRLAARHEVHVFALNQETQPGMWDLFGARIHNIGAAQTRLRAVRAICAEHRKAAFTAIQAVWSGSPGLVSVLAARILRIPCLVHVAGGELVALPDIVYGGRLSWKGRLREAAILRAATTVTAASKPMIEALAAQGIDGRRVPLGVDLNVWPPREPRRRGRDEAARLIHVASLNRVKDQYTLLRALALLAEGGVEFEMDIVGEDTLDGEVQALAERLGLSGKVTFHGFLPQQRIRHLVEAAHLMILTSRHEAGPLAVLEAAVAGVPTVGTAVGHIVEWSPGAARSVPVRDWESLATEIRRLLADEDQRLEVARAAFQIATREDATFTAQTFESLYAGLAARGRGGGSPDGVRVLAEQEKEELR